MSITNSISIKAAVRILGDKWSPRIIQVLAQGETQFCAIQRSLDDINPRSLTQKMQKLIREKVVIKKQLETVPYPSYHLTRKGRDILPILNQMGSWSKKYTEPT